MTSSQTESETFRDAVLRENLDDAGGAVADRASAIVAERLLLAAELSRAAEAAGRYSVGGVPGERQLTSLQKLAEYAGLPPVVTRELARAAGLQPCLVVDERAYFDQSQVLLLLRELYAARRRIEAAAAEQPEANA